MIKRQNYYTHYYAPDATKAEIVRLLKRHGIPLYEGISVSPDLRTGQHAETKPYWELGPIVITWATSMNRHEITKFEVENIRKNRYPFNDQGNPDYDKLSARRKAILSQPSTLLTRWRTRLRRFVWALSWFSIGILFTVAGFILNSIG